MGDRVLDVCCGSGDLAFLLSNKVASNGKCNIDASFRGHQDSVVNGNRSFVFVMRMANLPELEFFVNLLRGRNGRRL
ncbi:menaquinone biosynthesis methyltransferase ubiE [Trifolium medium]|uniref:Menaquinone biosynthesis methyltransferase ubiE n=1 Tax=Trifolium medium TaxID=97028 RepID=A0A392P129_9FABA|nr:menaquinone biosynthesis methyltransferase ubiE [Trifolium medium]